jgi:cobalt-zinc-cadmium resistance protein CzcA
LSSHRLRGDLRHPVPGIGRLQAGDRGLFGNPLGASWRGVRAVADWGLPFSVSAAVGFIVLAGVGVLNGLVVMTAINQRIDAGLPVDEAIAEGSMERFRAVLMTGIVPAIGFRPDGAGAWQGAEVQKPLAIVVIGGLITSTILTLFVLPAISHLLLRGRHKKHVPGDYTDVSALGERLVDK